MMFDGRFEELAGLAYRSGYRIVGRRAEAEDIAQDTMVKAMQRWRSVRSHARPWVCRVATNAALDVVRKQARRDRGLVAAHSERDCDGEPSVDRFDLQRALLSLPKRQREVVVLRFVADLTEREVSNELGVSLATVKTHARRGLDALQGELSYQDNDAEVADPLFPSTCTE